MLDFMWTDWSKVGFIGYVHDTVHDTVQNGPSEPLKSGLEAIIFPMDWNVSFACDADSLGFCIQLWQGNKSK